MTGGVAPGVVTRHSPPRRHRALLVALLVVLSQGEQLQAQTGINTPLNDKMGKPALSRWNQVNLKAAQLVWVANYTIRMTLRVLSDVQTFADGVETFQLAYRDGTGRGGLLRTSPVLAVEASSDADISITNGYASELVPDDMDAMFQNDEMVALVVADAIQEAQLAKAEAGEISSRTTYLRALMNTGAIATSDGLRQGTATAAAAPGLDGANGAQLQQLAYQAVTARMPSGARGMTAAATGVAAADAVACRSPFPAALAVAPEVQAPRVISSAIGTQAVSQARQARLAQHSANLDAVSMTQENKQRDPNGMSRLWASFFPR